MGNACTVVSSLSIKINIMQQQSTCSVYSVLPEFIAQVYTKLYFINFHVSAFKKIDIPLIWIV